MLLSLVFVLEPEKECILPPTTGNFVYAAFLSLLKNVNPGLAETFHGEDRDKPFSVSPLHGDFGNAGRDILLSRGSEYWFRVTSIDPENSRAIMEIPGSVSEIKLRDSTFFIKKIVSSSCEHKWASATNYRDIYGKFIPGTGATDNRLGLRFYSPTTFRSDRVNLPLPLPNLLFYGLAARWNRYAPVDLGCDIPEISLSMLSVARYKTETRMLDFGRYRQVGFIGDVEFLLKKSGDDIVKRVFHLLTEFAFYAGVGYKTTMGMGQARRL